MLSDRGAKPGALVIIVAVPTGRFRSSNRPSAPVVAVALPIFTDAPAMTPPVSAPTTPDTVAVAAGSPGLLPPHAGTMIDVAKASVSAETDVETRMRIVPPVTLRCRWSPIFRTRLTIPALTGGRDRSVRAANHAYRTGPAD